jgi:hypothetical protein
MSTSRPLACLSLIAASALFLTGCNSGSKKASAPAGSAAPASAGAASAPANAGSQPVPAASGNPAVTCQQLTFADVQPFIGEKITKLSVQFEGLPDDSGQQCTWTTSGDDSLQVFVLKGSGSANAYAQAVTNETDGAVAVPGVGDKASRDKGSAGIDALKGDIYCNTGMGDDLPAIGTLELAAGGTTNIGEPLQQDAAIAVGTLCNRIFGSGNTTPDLSAIFAAAASASASASASAAAQSSAEAAFGNSPVPAASS